MSEQMYEALSQNHYGEILEANSRFGRFKPEWVSTELWEDILGPDVNNLRHHEYTAGLTAWYIQESANLGYPISRQDQATLMMTAWTHDFAEAIDGDVPEPEKIHSDEQYAKEKESYKKVIGSVTPFGELMGIAVFPVMYGGCELARDFRAIELVGYTETAKTAGREAFNMRRVQEKYGLSIPQLRELHVALNELHDDVYPDALQKLEAFSDLPVVKEYLNGHTK